MNLDDTFYQFKLVSMVCGKCRHFRGVNPDSGSGVEGREAVIRPTCNAFPYKIPDEIWYEKNPHTEPYPGDQGIRFEMREEFVGEY